MNVLEALDICKMHKGQYAECWTIEEGRLFDILIWANKEDFDSDNDNSLAIARYTSNSKIKEGLIE